mmetsp:Transcript_21763/g.56809  ORF Transcript_21763/g.56809 Transcript_21763/m.56809 type:complete len:555 (+) Transcript_21763:196-1860(+)
MAPAKLLLLALAQQATTFQAVPPLKAPPRRDVSVEILPAGVVGLALGVSAAFGVRRTKKVLKRRKAKQEEELRQAVAEARAEAKREADQRVEEAKREAQAEALALQRAEIVQAQADAAAQRRQVVEEVQASYSEELSTIRKALQTATSEREANRIKAVEATEAATQLELDVRSLAERFETEVTTLEARVAEAEAERDAATEEAEKFERASEALQDEIFNLDVEFEQSSQAMNEQFQSDLERKLDQVKAAEKEKGAVAKRLAVDNTRRELTAEYEASMRQRSDEFEAARAKLEGDFRELAEASSEARSQLTYERSRAESLTSKLSSTTSRLESSEQRSLRLEQLARAAEQRITAQRELAQKARALAAEERDQWRGPASGAAVSAKRARELAALAEAAEKATAALPDVQAWRTDADVVERDGEFFVEDTFRKFDKDGDGVITPEEFASGLAELADSPEPPAAVEGEIFDEIAAASSERDTTRRIADGAGDVVARTEAAAEQLEKRLEEAAALSERLAAAEDANGEAPSGASAPVETGGEAVAPAAPNDKELEDLFA